MFTAPFLWKQRKSGVLIIEESAVAVSSTNTTNEEFLKTITIPGGLLGLFGSLEIITLWTFTNGADDKFPRVRFSGQAGTIYQAPTVTTSATAQIFCKIRNRGSQASQVGGASGSNVGFGAAAGAIITSSVDTSVDTTIVISSQKETGTDTCRLDGYCVKLIR
jgi:hypothetical protein